MFDVQTENKGAVKRLGDVSGGLLFVSWVIFGTQQFECVLFLFRREVSVNFTEDHYAFVFGGEATYDDMGMANYGETDSIVGSQTIEFVAFWCTVKIDRIVFRDITDGDAIAISVGSIH